jgi:hypothetical protein
MSRPAVFIPHQGFTDIFNSLSHIDYYLSLQKWSILYVIIREDAKDIVDFYCKDKNVQCVYYSLQYLDGVVHGGFRISNVYEHYKTMLNIEDYESLFLGIPDKYCTNAYKDRFLSNTEIPSENFVKKFYIPYDIDYSVRVQYFTFSRDTELEDKVYRDFINKHGSTYTLIHSGPNYHLPTSMTNCFELNQSTSTFFDSIKVLEHAQELHLLDSSWAILVYLLQSKYNLFIDKKIVIYCRARSQYLMFTEPLHPNISFVHMY